MFIVLLSFAENKHLASEFMAGHKRWIQQGMDDNVFLLVGSKQPIPGGCIIAHGLSADELEIRIAKDPFVEQKIVSAEIIQVTPNQLDERLAFLKS